MIRNAVACIAVVAIASLVGCAGGDGKCTLSGKVTYQGKTVCSGMVNLVGPKGEPATGAIEPDGTYMVIGAPMGLVKIGIISDKPPAPRRVTKQPRGAPPPPPPPDTTVNWFPIDAKYADPNTSGKEVTLKSGKNVFDLVLE